MSLSKVIETAHAELGVTENPPGSNRVKYWDAYDPAYQGQPWCVAFLWWVFREAGERMAFFGGGKTASCSMLLRWYKEQGLTVDVADIQAGDIVILNFHGTRDTEHCGLVTGVTDSVLVANHLVMERTIHSVGTIEGNTSPSDGSQSNGGMVCEKTRYPSQIVAVCRPAYQPEPQTVDDITGHWAEKAIRWAEENELVKGFPDGTFKPNQGVTRAEICVILFRFFKMILRLIRGEDDLK